MTESFRIVKNKNKGERNFSNIKNYGVKNAEKVISFHRSFPEYSETPLAELRNLAAVLGLKNMYVKDESYRFGLNAFKVLGGSFAIGNYIAKRLGTDISELPYAKMTSDEIRSKLGEITFVTATDGNHGRGVAWTANRLRQKSVVYMPKGTAPERLENIRKLGSEATITDLLYDDDVRLAKKCSEEYGWVTVQDTSWEGYEDIPGYIMQGYTTMAYEAASQLNGTKPTHIFLQAGVGSMAGAVCAFFTDLYGEKEKPEIIILEPNGADCIFRTAEANDGTLKFTGEDMESIMAGLCCGEPCPLAWNILNDYADYFVSVPDYTAAKGMRILGNPVNSDPKVISGESGASTSGFVAEVMTNPDLERIREELNLNSDSVVLCFSTEGDTDKENYRKIVWDGLHPSFRQE